MKKNLTEVVCVLDRSGSMRGLEQDTIGGYNSFIADQKKLDGECFVTTILFDDKYEILHDHINIKDVTDITDKEYYPRGMTALLDAIGKAINTVGGRLSATEESERPEKVMIIVTTDGQENSSTEFTKTQIKEMVSKQEDVYSWEFVFIGANIDSFGEAGSMGMKSRGVTNYAHNAIGTQSMFMSISKKVGDTRQGNARGLNMSMMDYYSEAEDEVSKKIADKANKKSGTNLKEGEVLIVPPTK